MEGSVGPAGKEDMDHQRNETRIDRNEEIWHANRVEGVGTAPLAIQHRLSRQRIRQIVARQEQLHAEGQGAGDQDNSGAISAGLNHHV